MAPSLAIKMMTPISSNYDSDESSALSSPVYPSPSPSPEPMSQEPPRKKRRVGDRPTTRSTQYLDFSDPDQEQVDRLMHVLHKHQKIVVVAGAGISVSAGSESLRVYMCPFPSF